MLWFEPKSSRLLIFIRILAGTLQDLATSVSPADRHHIIDPFEATWSEVRGTSPITALVGFDCPMLQDQRAESAEPNHVPTEERD
jgi:hypothetical protein